MYSGKSCEIVSCPYACRYFVNISVVQEEYAITNQVNAFATQGSPDLDVKQ
jgi:hypothetical protein